ncbi:MAG: hypothetical protein JNJ58_12195 [Chitinophagaceae bacterium]|nr:hypothetical protein [Chitinophagaceae bacterium]
MAIFILVFIFVSHVTRCQIKSWNHTSFRVQDGLPSNLINSILQDHRGFIWLVTQSGLCRFDGTRFDRLLHDPGDSTSPSTDNVIHIKLLPDSNILCTTTRGLYVFNPITFKGRNILIQCPYKGWEKMESIAKDIHLIPALKKIAVITETSVIYYDYKLTTSKTIRFPYKTNDIEKERRFTDYQGIVDFKGNVLIPTNYDDCLHIADYEKGKMYPFEEYKNHPYENLKNHPHLDIMTVDSLGNVWYHQWSNNIDTLYCLKPYGKSIGYNIPKELRGVGWYGGISFSGKDVMIWHYFNDTKKELYELPYLEMLENPGMNIYAKSNSSIKASNYTLITDKDDNVWIGHKFGMEFVKRRNNVIQKIELPLRYADDQESQWVQDMYFINRDSILILANVERVFLYEPAKNNLTKIEDPGFVDATTMWNQVLDMIVPLQGNRILLRGSQDYTYQDGKLTKGLNPKSPLEKSLYKNGSRAVYEDQKQYTWLALYNRLIHFNTIKAEEEVFMDYDNFLFSKISGFTEDESGNVWFANYLNNDLYRYSYKNKMFSKVKMPSQSFSYISSIVYAGDGIFYISDIDGFGRYNSGTNTVHKYYLKDGLPTNAINNLHYVSPYVIASSRNGCFILNTTNGVTYALNISDGIVENIVTQAGIYDTMSQTYYMGGKGCVYKVDMKAISQPLPSPQIFIEDIQIGNKTYRNVSQPLSLSSKQNSISFLAVSVDYHSGKNKHYFYRTVYNGDTSNWVENNGANFSFNNLSSGEYTIFIKSQDKNRQWSINTAMLQFTIATPWHGSWWFYCLLFLLPISIVLYYFYIKLKQYRHIEAIRNQLSRSLHDDLGSTLSSINILSSNRTDDMSKNKTTLLKINESSQRLLSNMRDIIWNINPDNDSIESILNRIREYSSTLLDSKGIDYVIQLPERNIDGKLSLEAKNAILLISKEAVNNIAKYAACTFVEIKIELVNNIVKGYISDNGKGFNYHALIHIGGLNNILDRAKEAKGVAEIISNINQGTKVIFSIPVKR